jgi:cytochrome c-type biogenesis protein CcmH
MPLLAKLLRCLIVAFGILSAPGAFAVQPDEILSNPTLEVRARDLSKELRCMVCQNQSIDDSDAPLARDLRLLVRERLKAGDSDRQVLDFLTARYGDFVLLRPRFAWDTAALWLTPAAALSVGIYGILVLVRRRRRAGAQDAALEPAQLSESERARLAELLDNTDPPPQRSS